MERLFVTDAQGSVFLLLTACGAVLGGLFQLLTALRREHPRCGPLADALFALLLGGSVLAVLLKMRETGLRLYALLGLTLGIVLWSCGPGSLIACIAKRLSARKRSAPSPENFTT